MPCLGCIISGAALARAAAFGGRSNELLDDGKPASQTNLPEATAKAHAKNTDAMGAKTIACGRRIRNRSATPPPRIEKIDA